VLFQKLATLNSRGRPPKFDRERNRETPLHCLFHHNFDFVLVTKLQDNLLCWLIYVALLNWINAGKSEACSSLDFAVKGSSIKFAGRSSNLLVSVPRSTLHLTWHFKFAKTFQLQKNYVNKEPNIVPSRSNPFDIAGQTHLTCHVKRLKNRPLLVLSCGALRGR
jgi:hypothetical protein